MGQVPNDVSHGMDDNALTVWVLNIVEKLKRKYPESNIIYKFHPLTVHQPMDVQLTPLLKSRGVSDIDSDWDVDFIPEQEITQKWFNAMTFSQWNLDEISNGVMWNYVKKHIGE